MKIFSIVLSCVLSVCVAAILGVYFWLDYGLWSIAVDVAMVFALPVASLLHEAGHMLFGAFVKIKAVPNFKIWGSLSCKLIPKTDKNLGSKVVFTAFGGATMNLLFIILAVVAVYVDALPICLALFAPASLYLFIFNTIPVQLDEGKTDGLVIADILSDDDEAKVMLAVLGVQAKLLKEVKIEEIEKSELFDLPQIREDDPAFIAVTELRYKYLEAVGESEDAEKYKKRFEELKEEYL